MARLIWTKESRWWLKEIHEYIARDSREAAFRVVHGIYDKAHLLLEFPDMGYLHEPKKYPGVRVLLYGKYRVVYERRADSNIYVLGVFHGGLDMKHHLQLK